MKGPAVGRRRSGRSYARNACHPGTPTRGTVRLPTIAVYRGPRPIRCWPGSTPAGWAPGDMPVIYPPGTAKRVPAGSKLVFEIHYTPTGTPHTDRSSVGIIFAKKPPERPVETNILANMFVRIPPGAADQEGR